MQLNGFTLNHLGLECLDTQTVQCRSTVQQNWVTLHYIFQNIPYYRILAVNNLLCRLDGLYDTALNQLTDDERLVKLGSHQLRNTALTHLKLRTYNDN